MEPLKDENGKVVRAYGDAVIIEADRFDETKGSLYLPEAYRENGQDFDRRLWKGTVRSVGSGPLVDGKRQKPDFNVGDRVVYERASSQPFGDYEDMTIVRCGAVYGRIEEE